ncbi:MAG: hypothetical protein ACTHJ9_06155 [Rhodanobacter sp.]
MRRDIFAPGSLDEEASRRMKAAIAESLPEITLDARADYLAALDRDGD